MSYIFLFYQLVKLNLIFKFFWLIFPPHMMSLNLNISKVLPEDKIVFLPIENIFRFCK